MWFVFQREFETVQESVKAVKEQARRLLATAKQAIGNQDLTPELKKVGCDPNRTELL